MMNRETITKRSYTIAILLTLIIAMFIAADDSHAAGGISGANIKDGVILGYYGDGGDIVVPNTVTGIAGEAFKGNDNVETITIPGSVKEIGYSAFEGCTALEKVIFSDPKDGAEMIIRVNAFRDCPKLTECTIPACCTYVTANVFKGCTSMKEIKVDPDSNYYASQDGVLYGPWVNEGTPQHGDPKWALIGYPAGKESGSFTIPEKVKGHDIFMIWASAFKGCENLTGLEIPASINEIRGNAFENTGLRELTIPDTVTNIGSGGLFGGCRDLTDVTFPDSCKTLSSHMFYDCPSLQRVKMDGVNNIEYEAFMNCTSLTNIVLPDGLAVIGLNAFKGCSNLQRVYIPPSVTSFPSDPELGAYNIFTDTSSDLVVYTVKGSTAERYVGNNADSFGIESHPINSKADLATVDFGEFSLADLGKKVRTTGKFKIDNSLKVESIEEGAAYDKFLQAAGEKAVAVYRISLLPDGSEIAENIDLSIGIPAGILSKNAELYRIESDAATKVDAVLNGKTFKVMTDSLGYYAVIGDPDGSSGPVTNVDAESVTLSKNELVLKEGKSAMLTTTVLPANTTNKSITWTSDNESVATVDNGRVSAVSVGEAKITASTVNGKTATCHIKVVDAKSIMASSASLKVGKKANAQGKVSFDLVLEDPSQIATIEIKLSSDDDALEFKPDSGFNIIGDPVRSEKDGKTDYTVVLTYLEEDGLFGEDGEAVIAKAMSAKDEPYAKIESIRIAGWGSEKVAKYGEIDDIDKSQVKFVPLSPYDFNEDGSVDMKDLDMAKSAYRESDSRYDVNADSFVDIADFIKINANFTE